MSTTTCHLSVLIVSSLPVHMLHCLLCNLEIFTFCSGWHLLCVTCCVLCTYRSSFCRSALRWTVKPATWAEVWCPLRGARVRLQSTLRFPSQRGEKHSASPSCQEISGDRKVCFFSQLFSWSACTTMGEVENWAWNVWFNIPIFQIYLHHKCDKDHRTWLDVVASCGVQLGLRLTSKVAATTSSKSVCVCAPADEVPHLHSHVWPYLKGFSIYTFSNYFEQYCVCSNWINEVLTEALWE